jgi:ribonuclease T2
MLDNLPPHVKRWGSVVILAIGFAWLWYHPDILYEDPVSSRPTSTSQPSSEQAKTTIEAGFDFYVLALSWSPSFCATKKQGAKYQCGGKRFFSFIVHGLWPQFEKGWPANCKTNQKKVQNQLALSMLDIMPGQGLIRHQWSKHGTCSGLEQRAYFEKVRRAYDKIRVPARYRLNDKYLNVSPNEVERAFQLENPGLKDNAIAVTCHKRRLREVRICLSKSLEFRACAEVNKNACRKSKITMPPVRGT